MAIQPVLPKPMGPIRRGHQLALNHAGHQTQPTDIHTGPSDLPGLTDEAMAGRWQRVIAGTTAAVRLQRLSSGAALGSRPWRHFSYGNILLVRKFSYLNYITKMCRFCLWVVGPATASHESLKTWAHIKRYK